MASPEALQLQELEGRLCEVIASASMSGVSNKLCLLSIVKMAAKLDSICEMPQELTLELYSRLRVLEDENPANAMIRQESIESVSGIN